MNFDNKDNQINKKIDDAVFSYVGACHIDNINQEVELNNQNLIVNPYQKELDKKIQDYIINYSRKQKWQQYMNTLKKTSKIAAVILVGIVIISTILISSVDALKVMFLNMFIEGKEDYSKITIENDKSQNGNIEILLNNEELKDSYISAYIPENFSIEKIMSLDGSTIIIFKDINSNSLIFEQSKDLNKEYMVDTEDAYTEKISIQGYEAIIIIKGEITTVLWQNNERIFNVCGKVDREKILKFCESLYLKK